MAEFFNSFKGLATVATVSSFVFTLQCFLFPESLRDFFTEKVIWNEGTILFARAIGAVFALHAFVIAVLAWNADHLNRKIEKQLILAHVAAQGLFLIPLHYLGFYVWGTHTALARNAYLGMGFAFVAWELYLYFVVYAEHKKTRAAASPRRRTPTRRSN